MQSVHAASARTSARASSTTLVVLGTDTFVLPVATSSSSASSTSHASSSTPDPNGVGGIVLIVVFVVALVGGLITCCFCRRWRRFRADLEKGSHAVKPGPPLLEAKLPHTEQALLERPASWVAFPATQDEPVSGVLAAPDTDAAQQVRAEQARMFEKGARSRMEATAPEAAGSSTPAAVPEDYETLKEEVAQLRLQMHEIAVRDWNDRDEESLPPAYEGAPSHV